MVESRERFCGLRYVFGQRTGPSQSSEERLHVMTEGGRKELLTLLLSQRLEINAVESALKMARVLTYAQIREIRTQALDTAKAWSSKDSDDVLALLRVHSSPFATMLVPLIPKQ